MLSLYLPMWPIDRLRRRRRHGDGGSREPCKPARPILITRTERQRDVVVRCCGEAFAAGVEPGMAVAHARALLPVNGVRIEREDADRDRQALEALARWAMRFSPIVAMDTFGSTHGLLIDATGCERLFHGIENLMRQLLEGVNRLGFHARLAAGPSVGAAWALAHYSPHVQCMVDREHVAEALASLPIAALRVEHDVCDALAEVGVLAVRELLALPRRELPGRFGQDVLLRLDQALGGAVEMIEPMRPLPPPRVMRAFEGPVKDMEAIQLTAHELIDGLCGLLLQRESGVRQFELIATRVDAPPERITIRLSHPSRDAKHLRSLLQPRVEKLHMGHGVDDVTLVATRIGPLPHEQSMQDDWRSDAQHDAWHGRQVGELVDTAASRLGSRRVLHVEPRASHVPERAYQIYHAMEDDGTGAGERSHDAADRSADRAIENITAPLPWLSYCSPNIARRASNVTPSPRPSTLLARPEPVDVIALQPEGPPTWLRWRGEGFRLIKALGPERIGEAWWIREEDREGETKRCRDEREGNGLRDQGTKGLKGKERRGGVESEKGSDIKLKSSAFTDQCDPRRSTPDLRDRDYFRVQDENGRWIWVFCDRERRRWFCQGTWG